MHIRYTYGYIYIVYYFLQKCDILEVASGSIRRLKVKALLFLDLNFKHMLACFLCQ